MHSAIRKALATVFSIPATASVVLIRLYQRTLSPDHPPSPRLRWASGLTIQLVKLYQATLSPDHGLMRHLYPHGFCRHHPTCSQYAIDAFRTRSFPVAIWLAIKRILSCHPWTKVSDERLKEIISRSA